MKKGFYLTVAVFAVTVGYVTAQNGPTFTIENPNQGKQQVKVRKPGKVTSAPTPAPDNAGKATAARHHVATRPVTADASRRQTRRDSVAAKVTTKPAEVETVSLTPLPLPPVAPPPLAVNRVSDLNEQGVGYLNSVSSGELKNRIDAALQRDPALAVHSLSVNVTDIEILLAGDVKTDKERTTAYRIASSFGGNRRVKDTLTVAGKSSPGDPFPPRNSPAASTQKGTSGFSSNSATERTGSDFKPHR